MNLDITVVDASGRWVGPPEAGTDPSGEQVAHAHATLSDTVLIIGHGSRERGGNDEIEQFAAQWRLKHPEWRIEVCFIEFAEVMLEEGLRRAAQGSRRVLVLPLILNAAGHAKMEIPEHIAEARAEHPGVQYLYAPHLGAGEAILKILRRQLRSAMNALDMPDPTGTGVIVLGRGSSDRGANGELAKMTRWLMEETDHELVDLAFTGITWPRLEKVVQRQALLGMRQIVVLPYYLFTGTLVQRIDRQIDHLRVQYPQLRFASGRYFGFEPEIFALMDQRVLDLLDGAPEALMPCDGCKFRLFAEEHGQGHHHHDDGLVPAGHGHAHVHVHAPAHPHQHPPEHARAHEHGHDHAGHRHA